MASEIEKLFQEMMDLDDEEGEQRLESLSVPEALRQELSELIQHDRNASHKWEIAVGAAASEALSSEVERFGCTAEK